ncbi:hypothetical protein B484DRAFT_232445 [Ochromonadaceae sp. CCMP2298]|nr:hypothetical protein B484DRAFT_232445 [Ochromonadaceae sp. CCMP2298]
MCIKLLLTMVCIKPTPTHSAMIKEQNEGLAAELEGFSFKPRINQTSLDLSATMKSLNTRIPEMIVERYIVYSIWFMVW